MVFPLCQRKMFETQHLNVWLRILYYLSEKNSDTHMSAFVTVVYCRYLNISLYIKLILLEKKYFLLLHQYFSSCLLVSSFLPVCQKNSNKAMNPKQPPKKLLFKYFSNSLTTSVLRPALLKVLHLLMLCLPPL